MEKLIYNPRSRNVVRSHSVVFNESARLVRETGAISDDHYLDKTKNSVNKDETPTAGGGYPLRGSHPSRGSLLVRLRDRPPHESTRPARTGPMQTRSTESGTSREMNSTIKSAAYWTSRKSTVTICTHI